MCLYLNWFIGVSSFYYDSFFACTFYQRSTWLTFSLEFSVSCDFSRHFPGTCQFLCFSTTDEQLTILITYLTDKLQKNPCWKKLHFPEGETYFSVIYSILLIVRVYQNIFFLSPLHVFIINKYRIRKSF